MSGSAGRLVVAHHGCDRKVRDALLGGTADLKPSNNPYDWLGPGIYFFEDDWKRALYFAQTAAENPERKYTAKPIEEPAVVGVILRVERWLDMATQEGIDEFLIAHRSLELVIQAKGRKMPINKPASDDDEEMLLRNLDRAVFKLLHEGRLQQGLPSYQAVRGPFTQGKPVVDTSAIRRHTHIQLAVPQADCIVGYFRVREAE